MADAAKPDYYADPPPRRVGVLALLDRGDDTFIIVRRNYGSVIKEWGLPGGSVPPDILPRRALTLIMHGKLGIRITPARLLALEAAPARPDRVEGVNYVFHVPVSEHVEIALAEDSGCVEARWLSLDDIHDLAVAHEWLRIQHSVQALRTGGFRELLEGFDLFPSTKEDTCFCRMP